MPVRAHHVELRVRSNVEASYDRGSVFRNRLESKSCALQDTLFPSISSKPHFLTKRVMECDIQWHLRSDPNSPNHKPSAGAVGLSSGVSTQSSLHIGEKDRFKTLSKVYGTTARSLPSHHEVEKHEKCAAAKLRRKQYQNEQIVKATEATEAKARRRDKTKLEASSKLYARYEGKAMETNTYGFYKDELTKGQIGSPVALKNLNVSLSSVFHDPSSPDPVNVYPKPRMLCPVRTQLEDFVPPSATDATLHSFSGTKRLVGVSSLPRLRKAKALPAPNETSLNIGRTMRLPVVPAAKKKSQPRKCSKLPP